jgi:hypothetical protein
MHLILSFIAIATIHSHTHTHTHTQYIHKHILLHIETYTNTLTRTHSHTHTHTYNNTLPRTPPHTSAGSRHRQGWATESHLCPWHGITCQTNRVGRRSSWILVGNGYGQVCVLGPNSIEGMNVRLSWCGGVSVEWDVLLFLGQVESLQARQNSD